MKGLNDRGEIKIDKLYKLRILIIASFIIIFLGAMAAITCWFIVFKPFEKFGYYEKPIIIGNTFDMDEVNLVWIENSVRPELYDFRYEIDGITYFKRWTVWSPNDMGKEVGFYYLVSDPTYTVKSRTIALIMLPIVFVILCVIDFVIVKIYLKERKKYIDYSKISIFGGKHGKK